MCWRRGRWEESLVLEGRGREVENIMEPIGEIQALPLRPADTAIMNLRLRLYIISTSEKQGDSEKQHNTEICKERD